MSPVLKIWFGLAATVLSAWLFHGPGGGGARTIARIDAQVQPVVARQELPTVVASFKRNPLSRDLRFRGPANAFQREQFVKIVEEQDIVGLRSVAWENGR